MTKLRTWKQAICDAETSVLEEMLFEIKEERLRSSCFGVFPSKGCTVECEKLLISVLKDARLCLLRRIEQEITLMLKVKKKNKEEILDDETATGQDLDI